MKVAEKGVLAHVVRMHEAEILGEAFRERVVRTDDAKEGPAAFNEKREPTWTGT